MRLYRKTDGSYARTQADAGRGATALDVPTDHRGLCDWLNANAVSRAAAPAPAPSSSPRVERPMTAEAVLAAIEAAPDGVDADAIASRIMTCGKLELARYAKAVAYAFNQLAEGR